MSHQIPTYTELRQQIHDGLRIQHPEWVEPNGESSMCLLELLDTFTRKGSNESVAAIHRVLHRCAVSIQSSPNLRLPAHIRFADLSALDMVDLNFKFVFHIGLHRRLASAPHSPVKFAFYVTRPAAAYYAKLHSMLTDNSTLDVALFTEREAAAKWLDVPVEVMMALRWLDRIRRYWEISLTISAKPVGVGAAS